MQRAIVAGLMLLACCAPALAQEPLPPPAPLASDPAEAPSQDLPAPFDDVIKEAPVGSDDIQPPESPSPAGVGVGVADDADDTDDGDRAEEDDELPPWDPSVPLWSSAGCLVGGLLGPVVPLGLAIPTAFFVVDHPELIPFDDPGCASILTVFACAGFGLAIMAPCSALGATLAATTAASSERFAWRPLVGGVPGVLCAVLAPLACLCFPLPGGSIITVIGLALGAFGGPMAVAGASLFDAQLIERAGAYLFAEEDAAGGDDVEGRPREEDQMHY